MHAQLLSCSAAMRQWWHLASESVMLRLSTVAGKGSGDATTVPIERNNVMAE